MCTRNGHYRYKCLMRTVFLLRLNNYIIYIRFPFPGAYYCNAIRFMTRHKAHRCGLIREKPLSVAPAVCRGHLEHHCRFSTTVNPRTRQPGWSNLSTRRLYATSIFVHTYLPTSHNMYCTEGLQ